MSHSAPKAFDAHRLAQDLSVARDRIPAASLAVPATIADSMAVQLASTGRTPGCKVALSPDGLPVTGWLAPLKSIVEGHPAAFPWRDGVRIEVEIAVRLGTALPPRDGGYSRAELVTAIEALHLGVEILDSRIEEGGEAPYLLFLADRLGNAGYALGPELPKEILGRVGRCQLDIHLGEALLYSGNAQHPAGDVLAWLIAYASDINRPSESLNAGEIVTTGALCGAIPITSPGTLSADLKGLEGIRLIFAADVNGGA
ncbi:fumarylacetoacetate hydrolase family protein [Oryzicola mucosus]|uniref:Fumarylacetoacetate hydrolase family protein n=1 Tax=Oryzicola mucosus TaxID=2767425 RepID=A0A8J6PQM8_9HYPH|nr:fumarylacetoacetate hydrolase family protein [Oryzicola mucosus]MBD0417037.1 fumarylacetoacetate hydrolase family protein [Oryzicola mucosus]